MVFPRDAEAESSRFYDVLPRSAKHPASRLLHAYVESPAGGSDCAKWPKSASKVKTSSITDSRGHILQVLSSSSRLFGVELDPENVSAVQTMLNRRGHTNTVLRPIDIDHWSEHPLLTLQYDVILCSHVLEHLPDPVNFLKIARRCLKDAGAFVGLVPINERKVDLHHLRVVNEETIRGWARGVGFSVRTYLEADPWLYWCQPVFALGTNRMRLVTQTLGLGVGIPATLLGPRLWSQLSRLYAAITASRPTQAGFVLTK